MWVTHVCCCQCARVPSSKVPDRCHSRSHAPFRIAMAVVDAGAAARKFDQLITTSHDDVLSLTPYADPTVLEPDADTLSVDMVIALLEPFAPKLKTRPANKKCVKGFVSVVRGCAFPEEFSLQKLADIWKNGCTPEALAALPQCIRPVGLTSQDTMQIIAVEEADGLYTILLHFLLNEPLTKGEVTGMSPGDLLTVPFRPDTWGAKKAFQRMLQSTQGWRLLFAKVGARADKDDSVSYTKVSLLKLQLSGPFHAGPISAILPKSVPHTFHSQAEKLFSDVIYRRLGDMQVYMCNVAMWMRHAASMVLNITLGMEWRAAPRNKSSRVCAQTALRGDGAHQAPTGVQAGAADWKPGCVQWLM